MDGIQTGGGGETGGKGEKRGEINESYYQRQNMTTFKNQLGLCCQILCILRGCVTLFVAHVCLQLSTILSLCARVRNDTHAHTRAREAFMVTVMCCNGFLFNGSRVSRAFLHTHERDAHYMCKWTQCLFLLNRRQNEEAVYNIFYSCVLYSKRIYAFVK